MAVAPAAAVVRPIAKTEHQAILIEAIVVNKNIRK